MSGIEPVEGPITQPKCLQCNTPMQYKGEWPFAQTGHIEITLMCSRYQCDCGGTSKFIHTNIQQIPMEVSCGTR